MAKVVLELARKAKRRLASLWKVRRDKARLAPLYAPDASDLDRDRHLRGALDWLRRAQDAGTDRGVSYGVVFGGDFEPSYPETTGYICRTFVEQSELGGGDDLLDRAIAMAEWEVDIQLPDGAVMGGTYNTNPTPAVFNTGMVLLGWGALVRRMEAPRIKDAAWRAGNWLVAHQEPDGRWIRGNSNYAARESTLYNVKAAWGLCDVGVALGEQRFVDAALRNAEYCLSRQHENGWFPDCCLSDPNAPLLHTLAYSMQGLMGIASLTGREDLVAGAKRIADAQIGIMRDDGFLPGRQRDDFSAAVDWCCLTGSAQVSGVWSDLHDRTGDARYRDAVRKVNRYLMAHHDIRNPDPRLRGGVPGSWPVWGDYGRLRILNWATKYLVDALSRESKIAG